MGRASQGGEPGEWHRGRPDHPRPADRRRARRGAVPAAAFVRSCRSTSGPSTSAASSATGDRRAAEAELAERRQRREEFDVRDLRPEERDRFRDSWNEIQRGFVDDPRRSLKSADLLVAEVMRARGYPVDDDFDRRADDLSVDHPRVVQHYREARQVRDDDGEVDTERQRTAVTSYRSLINALLGDDDRTHDADRCRRPARRPAARRPGHRAPDRPASTARLDARRADHTDGAAAGRHALRDDEPGAAGRRPTRRATRSPKTEEHTR